MTNSPDIEGRKTDRIAELIGIPAGVVRQPLAQWLGRRAERKELESRTGAIKQAAGERMRGFHDALWNRWGIDAVDMLLRGGKEPK